MTVVEDLPQLITYTITHSRIKDPLLVSFIYTKFSPSLRRELWYAIIRFDLGQSSWALAGDFNTTLSSDERNYALHSGRGACREFYERIADKELFNIGYIG